MNGRQLALALFITAISVSPRISVGVIPGGRRFDLRVEDIMTGLILVVCIAQITRRGRVYIGPLAKPLAAYLVIGSLTTMVGLIVWPLDLLRAAVYLGKEIEYVVMFLIITNLVRDRQDIRFAVKWLLAGGLLNVSWMGLQLLQGNYRPLFATTLEESYGEMGSARFYGPSLIGEYSPLQTGGFLLIIFLITISLSICASDRVPRTMYRLFGLFILAGILSSASRASMLAVLIGTVVTMLILSKTRRAIELPIELALSAVMVGLLLYTTAPATERLFISEGYSHGFEDRLVIWDNLLNGPDIGVAFGFGKSALGFLRWLPSEEAHNYYLRVMLESGVLGLISFILVLIGLVKLGYNLSRSSSDPLGTAIGASLVAGTVGIAITGIVQDVFISTKIMELFWTLAALATASYRYISRR